MTSRSQSLIGSARTGLAGVMVSWLFVLALLALWQSVPTDSSTGARSLHSGGMMPARLSQDEGLRPTVHAVEKRAEDRFAGGTGDLILTLGYVTSGPVFTRGPIVALRAKLWPTPLAVSRPLARAPPHRQA